MTVRFSEDFLIELRNVSDIETVVSSYVSLKRKGKILSGLCPFHNEKTPSFTVYPETQSYYCFGCGNGGDVITFIKNIENLSYGEAVRFLAERAGLPLPEVGNYDAGLFDRKRRLYEANRVAARFFHRVLYSPEGEIGLRYLYDRGLFDEIIRKFGLGYAPNSWDTLKKYMLAQGFKEEELYEANLLRLSNKNNRKHYFDAFMGRVMFPIIDLRGNVLAFSGRTVFPDKDPRKYVNTSDTLIYKKGENVFGLNFAKKSQAKQLILCEGNMDVVSLHQAGFTNAVAGLGTALTEQQAGLMSHYVSDILICYDNDEAGQKATQKALRIFSKTTIHVKVIRMQGGKDPDEIIKKHGVEYFKRLLNQASNDTEYRILRAKEAFDVTTSDGKIGFLREACKILAKLQNPVELDVYATRLSEELGVQKDAILLQVKRSRNAEKRYTEKNRLKIAQNEEKSAQKHLMHVNPERTKFLRAASAEEMLLASLMNNPDYFRTLESELSEDLFLTAFNRKVYKAIEQKTKSNGEFMLSMLSEEFEPEELSAVAKIQTQIPNLANTLAECKDCIRVLREEKQKNLGKDVSALSNDEFLNLFKQ